jgi:carboxyl-terminal processing protease
MKNRKSVLLLASILAFNTYASDVPRPKAGDPADRYANLELFQSVLHYIEANYVEPVKNKDLIYGAIKGMMETLDPHSNFMTPEIFRDMKIDTSGKFGGLGIEIGMKDNVLTVISPIEDTPAWRAGIKPNDRIVKINGESTKGMTLIEAVSKMRGVRGSDVMLGIYREGFEQAKDIRVARDIIKIQAVKSEELEPLYGYVRLASFNESAAADVKKAINKLQAKHKLRGLVFDLRYNPGGLLDQAVDVSSLFYDSGVVVSTIGRNKDQKEIKYAHKGDTFKDFPVVVLVNSSTASAAEIVSGALQDNHRAIIMGQPTFGKGSVQTVIDLGNDLGLKLTIARYYTPSGRSIQEKGVQPDILLDDFDSKLLAEARKKGDVFRERDLKGHMVNTDTPEVSDDEDVKKPNAPHEAFKSEELKMLSKLGKSGDKSKSEKDKSKNPSTEEDEMAPLKLNPKEDYQVGEALNYLKSFDVFKKLSDLPMPTHTGAAESTASAPKTEAPHKE